MLLSIILLPLLSSIFAGFGGKIFGRKGSVVISVSSIFICWIFSITLFYKINILHIPYYLVFFPWIQSGLFLSNWAFLFDTLTSVMLVIITSISLLVHLYSSEYMAHDPHLSRFMSYLSLFTFFMIILVTADNFVVMFVGWEGVGFCSYLLINFWYTRLQANKAAIKAMIVNRISDFSLVLGLLIIFTSFKAIDYVTIFSSINSIKSDSIIFLNFYIPVIDIICLLLFIGAMGKSAQLFLHVWLPDAMEGPTPVSALIHAATMVTAGVFLLARCSALFENSPIILNMIICIGSMTAFFAGTVGLTQNDLKKVIAYSTCSQLGYMVFACGLSGYNIGVFHLSNHAFFKALLFLSAGSVIHALSDEQDMRRMGGLQQLLPFTYMMFVIGSLALMGFPFLSGFYSKDAILELSYSNYNTISHFAYWLGTFAALCTSFYSVRLIFLTFLLKTNSYKKLILSIHESPFRMSFPLFLLAFGSMFIGYLSKDMFIGLGNSFWGNSIFIFPKNLSFIDAEFLPTFFKLCPLFFSLFGSFFAVFLYSFNLKLFYDFKISSIGIFFYNFFNRKWFFDKVYHEYVSQNLLNISYLRTYKLIDKGIIEILGPFGLVNEVLKFSSKLSFLQTGYIYNYSFFMLLNLIIFLILILKNKLSLFVFLFLLYFIN